METKTAHTAGKWSLIGAVLSEIAAATCCVLPVALLGLGVGGTWASRLAVLEPYRPVLVALTVMLLGFAFYRAYRPMKAESCSAHGSCRIPASPRLSRAAVWIVSPPLLALAAIPSIVKHLPRHLLTCGGGTGGTTQAASDACCAVPASQSDARSDMPQKESNGPIDPAREIVFHVESLQCPAVKGVGCGSMLAPVLARIDRVDGVSRSFANWTGTRLRISAAPGADRNAVADRVAAQLSADGRRPVRVDGSEFGQTLQREDWHSAERLVDLSSYEFRTIAKRRLAAFADDEGLDSDRRKKLLNLVDDFWERSAEGLDKPGSEAGAYGQYWRARLDGFIGAYAEPARDILTQQQLHKLLRQYHQRVKPPADE